MKKIVGICQYFSDGTKSLKGSYSIFFSNKSYYYQNRYEEFFSRNWLESNIKKEIKSKISRSGEIYITYEEE